MIMVSGNAIFSTILATAPNSFPNVPSFSPIAEKNSNTDAILPLTNSTASATGLLSEETSLNADLNEPTNSTTEVTADLILLKTAPAFSTINSTPSLTLLNIAATFSFCMNPLKNPLTANMPSSIAISAFALNVLNVSFISSTPATNDISSLTNAVRNQPNIFGNFSARKTTAYSIAAPIFLAPEASISPTSIIAFSCPLNAPTIPPSMPASKEPSNPSPPNPDFSSFFASSFLTPVFSAIFASSAVCSSILRLISTESSRVFVFPAFVSLLDRLERSAVCFLSS